MITMNETVAMFGGICGVAGLVISLICVACVVGFTRSTHTVQYVPADTPAISIEPTLPDEFEEEQELLKKVGRKPKPINPAENAVEDITQTDNF